MLFPTTHWTQLGAASLSGDPQARAALERLCRDYREPVRAFVRQLGYAPEEVDDFTQEFFTQLLETRAWKRADRAQGRFRTFIRSILLHVISRETARAHTAKRGGGQIAASLETLIEDGVEFPAPSPETHAFDREWAFTLLNGALAAVREKHAAHWPVLCGFLPGAGEPPSYEDAARQLGLPLNTLKNVVHRLRTDFRDELRRAVARTVEAPHEIADELAYLRAVLAAQNS